MKKFSKINESKDMEILGWSPNDILKELSKIPNCRVSYKMTQFIFREDGHEMCTLEEIKNGEIKSQYHQQDLASDNEYHPQYAFILDFGNFFTEKYLLFDGGEELGTFEEFPLYKLTNVFIDIQNSVNSLRNDFYVHIYQENKNIDLHHLEIWLDFTQKDSVEADYLISRFK